MRRLLGSALAPQAVPASFMVPLLARCEGGVLSSLVDTFEPGATVRIVSGPFADRIAVIDRLGERDRVSLLLEVMGTTARLDMPQSDLAPV